MHVGAHLHFFRSDATIRNVYGMNSPFSADNREAPAKGLSQTNIDEARAKLHRYFELAWKVFIRLENEGRLDEINLTASKVNPTVKPRKPLP